MFRSRRDSKVVSLVIGALIVLFGVMTGCSKALKTVVPSRGAPGEEFTLNGSGFAKGSEIWKAPELLKCETTVLEVVSSSDTAITVRVPKDTPAGLYEIYAYTTPTGAAEPSKTNFLKFWVLAAPVPPEIEGAYEIQVRSFRTRYGKTAEWEDWMIANKDRYNLLFETSRKAPCPIGLAVSYESPVTYDPPWASESEHMAALKAMAELSYPGYRCNFDLSLSPANAYAQVLLGLPENLSSAAPGLMKLHFEGIFHHEFAHVFNAIHHYSTEAETGTGKHFPPGAENYGATSKLECVMDRVGMEFCSACRTAMNIPLDLHHGQDIADAIQKVNDHKPVF